MISPSLQRPGDLLIQVVARPLISLCFCLWASQGPVEIKIRNTQGERLEASFLDNLIFLKGASHHAKDEILGSVSCIQTRVATTDSAVA